MANDDGNAFDARPPRNGTEVGYCKPPASHRFKRGQSGNPRGRPRKKRPIDSCLEPISTVIREELCRLIAVREGDIRSEIPAIQAVVRKTIVGAAGGNSRQQQAVLKLALRYEETRKAALEQDYKFAHGYHDRWKPIFAKALRDGSAEPTQLPHPAHIKFEAETGQIIICGPIGTGTKIAWEWLKRSLRELEFAYEAAVRAASEKPRNRSHARLVVELKDRLAEKEKVIPQNWNWREELGWEHDWEEYFSDLILNDPQRLTKILSDDLDAVIP